MDPATRFQALVERMLATSDATYGAEGGAQRAFGATSLKSNGKIFVMLVHDRLVVKLDRRRVDELVEQGVGERFDPGSGRLMREWLAIAPASVEVWDLLAIEAEAFVAGRPGPV
jgi:hypothetical protein